MSDLLFYEWDYDTNEVIEYRREGECNGCGECCMALIHYRFSRRAVPEDRIPATGGDATDGEGVWFETQRGNLRRFFKYGEIGEIGSHVCSKLNSDLTCAVQAFKGLYNKMWPMNPRQITPFPSCSYTMTEINRWPFEENESVAE